MIASRNRSRSSLLTVAMFLRMPSPRTMIDSSLKTLSTSLWKRASELAAVLTLLSSQTKTFFELNNGDSYILYVAMYLGALQYTYLKNTRIVIVFRVWIVE